MIRFLHYRAYSEQESEDGVHFVTPAKGKGGVTVAYTEDEGGQSISFGTAFCHEKDMFNRALGRTIATGRLNVKPETFDGDYKAFIQHMDANINPTLQFRAIQINPKE